MFSHYNKWIWHAQESHCQINIHLSFVCDLWWPIFVANKCSEFITTSLLIY
ncbi:MAG: hypothetical protein ACI914_001508 [Candidatus Marivariicella framensis]|jgi:hypothetical protein